MFFGVCSNFVQKNRSEYPAAAHCNFSILERKTASTKLLQNKKKSTITQVNSALGQINVTIHECGHTSKTYWPLVAFT